LAYISWSLTHNI